MKHVVGVNILPSFNGFEAMINMNEYEYIKKKYYKCVRRTPLAFEFCHNLSFQVSITHYAHPFFLFIAQLFNRYFHIKFFYLKIFNHKLPLPCCPSTGQYPQASSSHLLLQVPLQLYMTESVH